MAFRLSLPSNPQPVYILSEDICTGFYTRILWCLPDDMTQFTQPLIAVTDHKPWSDEDQRHSSRNWGDGLTRWRISVKVSTPMVALELVKIGL